MRPEIDHRVILARNLFGLKHHQSARLKQQQDKQRYVDKKDLCKRRSHMRVLCRRTTKLTDRRARTHEKSKTPRHKSEAQTAGAAPLFGIRMFITQESPADRSGTPRGKPGRL